MKEESKIIADYYGDKIRKHGVSPEGVDWNGKESQYVRFDELSKVLPGDAKSCADIGCGYGAYLTYLNENGRDDLSYTGYDLSEEMINEAVRLHGEKSNFVKIDSIEAVPLNEYAIASGIFNVRQNINDDQWTRYIQQSLRLINNISSKGFAFNLLTSYSDVDKQRDYLYYASPEEFFKFCKENFSKNVALLHDYGLYEFTIIVRK